MSLKTQEQYIADCVIEHNNFYCYDELIYINSKSDVKVTCPIHGSFTIRAKNHIAGRGCSQCGLIKQGMKRRLSYDNIVEKANLEHENLYSYLPSPKNPINGPITKITVICRKHGEFEQLVSNHLRGAGCYQCDRDSKRWNSEDFINKAVLSGYKYDYSEVEYSGSKVKVKIICPYHGSFWQYPAAHLQGQGCPGCCKTGYRTDRPGKLYILSNDLLTKIGITNSSTKRLNKLNRSGKGFKTVFEFYFEDGNIARRLETELLKDLRNTHNQPTEKFDGYTECFYDVDIPLLIEDIARRLKT